MPSIDQVIALAKQSGAAVIGFLILFVGVWFHGVVKQKRRNDLNEIDLSAKKIDFETHSKPLGDLVGESNKSHGADPSVVKVSGNDDKKG